MKIAKDTKNNTQSMLDLSKEILGHSEQISKRTDDLERQMLKDRSHFALLCALDMLFQDNTGACSKQDAGLVNTGVKAVVGEGKESDALIWAGTAIESMWFQSWKGDYGYDLEMLDYQFLISVETLFARMVRHVPFDAEVDVSAPDASYKAVSALSVKLELMDRNFEAILQAKGLPQLNLYNVIMMALRNRDNTNYQGLLPRTVAKILEFEREAIYLLQLRHNQLPLMVFARLTDFTERSNFGRLWAKHVGIDGDVSERLQQANSAQLRAWTSWLVAAQTTRNDLASVGIVPVTNKTYLGLAQQLDISERAAGVYNVNAGETMLQLRRAFVQAYREVVPELVSNEAVDANTQNDLQNFFPTYQ